MKRVLDIAKLKICFNSRFVSFSYGLFSKTSSTAISIVSCNVILVKDCRHHAELKDYRYHLPVVFFYIQRLNESLAQYFFWDKWIKKFTEKFSKIVIISAYGRNNWSKRKVFRIK